MSIDINAFRLIANQSPDKFVYAQGDTLKASHSDTSHGEHTYRAATNAFLKACGTPTGPRRTPSSRPASTTTDRRWAPRS